MMNCFAVVAKRNGDLFLISHHKNKALATKAIHRIIDTGALEIVPAHIKIARNGNVQLWRSL